MKTSVIIVTYNASGVVKECLSSLESQTYRDFEVIIVDNNSSDDTTTVIESANHRTSFSVKTFRLDSNLGFTGGNNYALKHASGKYIALLNPDTCTDRSWLEEMVNAMEKHPEAGICASKLIVYGSTVIDSAGDCFSTAFKSFKRGDGDEDVLYEKSEYVFGACAGAALYRKKMIDEIGFLDNDFFLIQEDADINFRAQLTGWKTLYVPTAVVYHKVRSSIGYMSDTAAYYSLRNSDCVRIKNISTVVFLKCMPTFIIGAIVEFIYFVVRHGRFRVYFKAKTDAIRMLPAMLKKRKTILKNRKVSNTYIIEIMTPAWQWGHLKSKARKLFNG